jgi:hypothetical protein
MVLLPMSQWMRSDRRFPSAFYIIIVFKCLIELTHPVVLSIINRRFLLTVDSVIFSAKQ